MEKEIATCCRDNYANELYYQQQQEINKFIMELEKSNQKDYALIVKDYVDSHPGSDLRQVNDYLNNYIEESNLLIWQQTDNLNLVDFTKYPHYVTSLSNIDIYSTNEIKSINYIDPINRFLEEFEQQDFVIWDEETLSPVTLITPTQIAIDATNKEEEFVAIVGMKEIFRKPTSDYFPGGDDGGGDGVPVQSRQHSQNTGNRKSKSAHNSQKRKIVSSLKPASPKSHGGYNRSAR